LEMEKQLQLKKTQSPSSPSEIPKMDPLKKQNKTMDMKVKTKKPNKKKPYSGYKEVVRDKEGSPKLPLLLGDLTVETLGTIIPYSPFVTEKHIWPVGFKSFRYFSSMVNPELRVKYTSQILDDGDKPQFIVTAEDDLDNPIISYSPSGAWRSILKKVMSKNPNEEARKNISVSGTLRFGLAHPIVSHLIRELPGAERCKDSGESWSSSPSNSPSLARKRRSDDDLSDSEMEEVSKKQKRQDDVDEDYSPLHEYDSFSARGVFASRKELEDLESAVATLHALKYCTVY